MLWVPARRARFSAAAASRATPDGLRRPCQCQSANSSAGIRHLSTTGMATCLPNQNGGTIMELSWDIYIYIDIDIDIYIYIHDEI